MRNLIKSGMIAAMLACGSAWAAPTTPPAAKAPAPTAAKAGDVRVIATCNDGTEWRARSDAHQGACSRHKGVKSWTDGSTVRASRGAPLNPIKPTAAKAAGEVAP